MARAEKDTDEEADHCIDNLRQKVGFPGDEVTEGRNADELQLMCDADVGILTYVWVKGHPMPFPDFSVYVFCGHQTS